MSDKKQINETDMTIDENEENQEIELTPNQAIVAAILQRDHVAMQDAFNAAVREKIDAIMSPPSNEDDGFEDDGAGEQE